MQMSWAYHLVMLAVAAHLFWQLYRFDLNRPDRSFSLFRANILTGVLLVIAALAGVYIR